jgi:Phage tail tube protein
MAVGSGLCSQFGFKNETTVGTPVTVDHFYRHTSVGGDGLQLITVTDEGLGGCFLAPTIDRTATVGSQVSRDVELNVGTRGLGLIYKQMLGATLAAPVLLSGAFYRSAFWNGDPGALSQTVQFGVPETTQTGTVRAFTDAGAKITQWELSQARNDLLKLKFSYDAWSEATATALATATYTGGVAATINEPLRFNCFSAKIGGTPSVATSVVSVAGGVEIKGCRGVSAKGTMPVRTDGFFSGGAGIKSNQILASGFQQFTADLDIEFQDRTQIYDIYAAYTTVALELSWVGKVDAGTSQFGKLSVIYPQCKIMPSGVNVTGPEGADNKTTLVAYADPAGVLPTCQLLSENLDVTF